MSVNIIPLLDVEMVFLILIKASSVILVLKMDSLVRLVVQPVLLLFSVLVLHDQQLEFNLLLLLPLLLDFVLLVSPLEDLLQLP